MSPRTRVVIVSLGSMVTAIAAGIVAFQTLTLANADQPVPGLLPGLVVVFLVMNVALLFGASGMQKRLPAHQRSRRRARRSPLGIQ